MNKKSLKVAMLVAFVAGLLMGCEQATGPGRYGCNEGVVPMYPQNGATDTLEVRWKFCVTPFNPWWEE